MSTSNYSLRRLRLSLLIAAISGFLNLAWLLFIPNEAGLSLIRVGLAIILGAGTLLPLVGLTSTGFRWLAKRLQKREIDPHYYRRLIFLLVLVALNGIYLLLLAPEAQDVVAQAMLTRLSPLILYIVILCILGTVLLLPSQLPAIQLSIPRRIFWITLFIFGVFLLGWGLIWLTKWGLTPEPVGWYRMGIPILEIYVFLAWLMVLLAGKIYSKLQQKFPQTPKNWRIDALISICLYLLAVLMWFSTSAPYNWFVTQPYPPNQESYPSSDALRYDTTAQSLLIGEGLKTDNSIRTLRPLYTGMLAILHAISGPDYQPVINLQVFVLAIFPVILYFLGMQMHSRMSGFFLALLIIFREQTAIELSDRITISHAKLLMADLPTAVALAGFILLIVTWMNTNKPRWQMAIFSGGALGATMLIRSESLIFIIVVIFVAWLLWRKNGSTWLVQLAIFGVGILLVTAPWFYRNWHRYGIVFFDAPDGRLTGVIERALEVPPTLPDETASPLSLPATQDPAVDVLMEATPKPRLLQETPQIIETQNATLDNAVTIIADRPHAVLISIINQYLNSEIQSILAIPTTFRLPDSLINFLFHKETIRFWRTCCQAIGYYERMPYWQSWGELPAQAILPLLGNLFLISIGIAFAYNRLKWVGLFPLMAHITFLAGIALFRTSGGRYILPVTWIIVLYYAIGVSALTIWVGKFLGWIKDIPGWNKKCHLDLSAPIIFRKYKWVKILIPVAVLLVIGCALPLLESAYPRKYTQENYQKTLNAVAQTLKQDEKDWLFSWLATENAAVRYGQALYPRFLKAGRGERDDDPGVMARDYDRLTFSIIGPYNLRVHLPISELKNGFPNGEDVFVVGCIYTDDAREVIDAKFVARVDMDGTINDILWREENHQTGCMP